MKTPEVSAIAAIPVAILILCFTVILFLMYRSFRNSRELQANHPDLQNLTEILYPKNLAKETKLLGQGEYITTIFANENFKPVKPHGLAHRSKLELKFVNQNLLMIARPENAGASLYLPINLIEQIFLVSEVIGHWLTLRNAVVIRWRLRDTVLDTAVLIPDNISRQNLLDLNSKLNSSIAQEPK